MRSGVRAFFMGFASIGKGMASMFSWIVPTNDIPQPMMQQESLEADNRAIADDWLAVRHDMQQAMLEFHEVFSPPLHTPPSNVAYHYREPNAVVRVSTRLPKRDG